MTGLLYRPCSGPGAAAGPFVRLAGTVAAPLVVAAAAAAPAADGTRDGPLMLSEAWPSSPLRSSSLLSGALDSWMM